MRSWLAIFVTLVACKDPDVETLTAIRDRVCACETAGCAADEMTKVPQDRTKWTHRAQAIARGMLDCLADLQAAERTTDPDAEASGTDGVEAAEGAAPGSAEGSAGLSAAPAGGSAADPGQRPAGPGSGPPGAP